MPINIQITFVHTTDGRLLCQLSAYIYINIEMTQISATWEVLPIERFLTNLTTFWLYEIYGGIGLYIQYTLQVPTEKPFLSTHRPCSIGQRPRTFYLLYSDHGKSYCAILHLNR